jgi:NAD(P)-dependent dehydrogenase (short-subunit alcohol dehydrogenase family)
VRALIDFTLVQFGRVDCLINNAAVPLPMTKLTDVDLAQFDRMIATNYRGVLLGMKMVSPHMIAQRSGSIINISSVANLRTGFSSHGYTSAKAAVSHLTRSVASELGLMNIRVNSISPGGIATGIFGKNAGVEGSKADLLLESVKEIVATVQPIPRSGVTDDIGHAAVFLASEWSSFITGHDLVVDGGLSLGGVYYQQGMDFRAELYKSVMQAADRLNS